MDRGPHRERGQMRKYITGFISSIKNMYNITVSKPPTEQLLEELDMDTTAI
jgi:hypothetical protein